jgi:acylphosphatase
VTRQRRHVIYSGNVQGVGFRYAALRAAEGYDVTGFVRNLPDGDVELLVEGTADQVQVLLDDVAGQMAAYITRADETTSPATGEFQGFTVRP